MTAEVTSWNWQFGSESGPTVIADALVAASKAPISDAAKAFRADARIVRCVRVDMMRSPAARRLRRNPRNAIGNPFATSVPRSALR
jgi:hypothetical protein